MTSHFLSFVLGVVISFSFIGQESVSVKVDFTISGKSAENENIIRSYESSKVLSLSKRSEDLPPKSSRRRPKPWNNPDLFGRSNSKPKDDSQSDLGVLETSLMQRPGQISESEVARRNSRIGNNLNITYLGCVATWSEQRTVLSMADDWINASHTPQTCARECIKAGGAMQLIFLRGAECQCSTVFSFNSTYVNETVCNVHCPFTKYATSETTKSISRCGGNLGYSLYCVPGNNRCDDPGLKQPSYSKETSLSATSNELALLGTSSFDNFARRDWALESACTVCNYSDRTPCKKPYLTPDYDHFPANSPRACVEFCSSGVNYVNRRPNMVNVRQRTTYAVLTWWQNGFGEHLPLCRCLDQQYRQFFVSTHTNHCNMPCPGSRGLRNMCGGLEVHTGNFKQIYSTIYCVSVERGDCQNFPTLPTEATTIPDSTTTALPPPSSPSPSSDPCDLDFVDCDEISQPPGNSTQPTTEEPTTPDERLTETTTEIPTTTTTETPPTELETTPETTQTLTTTTTTPRTTTEPIEIEDPGMPCKIKCQKTDLLGHTWEACAGTRATTYCSRLIKRSTGRAHWWCSENGEFASVQPDVSGCKSAWVEERKKEVEDIKKIDEAGAYMKKLEEECRDAQKLNSEFKYFGHDIVSIASLVESVLSKVRKLDRNGNFEQFELIIQNAININALLIQYRDPWEYLSNINRSLASTYTIETAEYALLNLTSEYIERNQSQNYSQIFSSPNVPETDLFKFLLFAETFEKGKHVQINEGYEFPPLENRGTQDSYITLPPQWQNLLKNDKVEIAAMSIDAGYISYSMPGQFENLTSGAQLEGEDMCDSKLINGRLISLTVASPQSSSDLPRMVFTGKGVEIVFQHDIEAWGDEKQDVPRKLHYREKPRAVLGSTQCVYWDTSTFSWSSKGCRIVRSDRFQTVCECSHLTSFAVLMDVHRYVGKQLALEILTLILCPLSEIALILSIIILSAVSNLQKIRTTITKNLAVCLFVGNAMVLFVLDRNYFNMSEGLCVGAAMITHYIFLSAFMWMLVEGVQLYRMVVHVFDSGKSYLKHFGVFAYGCPLIMVAITATTGYLLGDKPYGGDVYCWLEGNYIWSFMAPVAVVIMINFVILFIALKTAYQLQQSKKLSPTFFNGKIRSYKTWFKGCFSLTCILGLTWAVGFFTLMKTPSGLVAAYVFTILNASQGIFIFLFNCVFNEKVRTITKRNLSTYLPSWLTSSFSSSPGGNDASLYGKRPLSPTKTEPSVVSEKSRKRLSKELTSPSSVRRPYSIPQAKLEDNESVTQRGSLKTTKVDFVEARNTFPAVSPIERHESVGTTSSEDSLPNSSTSENGHISSDTSQSALISAFRSKTN